MDQRERWNDDEEALRTFLEGWQRKLWTAMPGIVESFDPGNATVSIQPSIRSVARDQAGVITNVSLPLLIMCPVMVYGGGGFSLSMPIAQGNEALVVFASRCMDAWWQSGGVQNQIELRLHNLSDGFAFVGFRSLPRALSGYSSTTAQLRSDDGASYVEMASGHVVNIVAPGGVNITAPVTTVNGTLLATGPVTGNYGGPDQVGLTSHTHSTPDGTSGPPNAGT